MIRDGSEKIGVRPRGDISCPRVQRRKRCLPIVSVVQGKSQATTEAVTCEDDALAQQTEFKDEIKS